VQHARRPATHDTNQNGEASDSHNRRISFCLLYTVAIVAQDRSQRSWAADAASAKAEVNKLGFGKRVNVKLKDGKRASGRITGFAPDHFVVTDSKAPRQPLPTPK